MSVQTPTPGAVVQIRSTPWKVHGVKTRDNGFKVISCKGIAGITKGKEASFVLQLEPSLKVLRSMISRSSMYLSSKLLGRIVFAY